MTTIASTPPATDPRRTSSSVLGRALGTTAVATAVTFGLHHAGRFGLAAPPGLQPAQLIEWCNDVGATVAAMTILRLVAMGTSLYVGAVGALAIAASARPSARCLRIVRGATPRVLRRALGIGALTALSLPAGIAASRTPPEAPPVMVLIDAPAPPSTPTLAPPPPGEQTEATEAALSSTWIVRSGDHFWSIAAATLHERAADTGDADVASYWRLLVEANRDRLAEPGNPDLLFAGQELVLPALDNLG